MRVCVGLFMLSMSIACEGNKSEPVPIPAPIAGQPATLTPVAPKKDAAEETAFVTSTTALKREGSDKAKIDDGKGKQIANWLATLHRGEKITLLRSGEDYLHVRTSNDLEGWIKRSHVLSGAEAREATVLEQLDVFERPDLLALSGKKKVPPGSLLFIVKTREQFSEVNVGGAQNVWVLTGKLSTDSSEIMVAKLLAKARSLKDAKSQGVEDLMNLARSQFQDTRLVPLMEQELGLAPASQPASQPL